jgi:hypothetical protein
MVTVVAIGVAALSIAAFGDGLVCDTRLFGGEMAALPVPGTVRPDARFVFWG